MSIHLATINGQPVDYNANTVRCMALHLLAGVTAGLDLTNDHDVIRYLTNTPERYRAAVVTCHMDAAIADARQTIVGAIMGAM